MKHLQFPEKEITLIFSFVGSLISSADQSLEQFNKCILKSLAEDNLDLIKQINEYPFKVSTNATVSMSIVVCNFMKNILVVKDPHLSSGTLDSRFPWSRSI